MQGRMKQHQLSQEEIAEVLEKGQVGRIGTIGSDGFPYVVPVHYVVMSGRIYIHGLIKGQKIADIALNDKVGFEVDKMHALLSDVHISCDVNTAYRSVIIKGKGRMIEDLEIKIAILKRIVAKYTPHLTQSEFPEKMIRATGIIEIDALETTGKFYK